MVSEDDVRRICLQLPETTETPYERMPGFRVKDKLFARVRDKPYALFIVRPSIMDKEMLIQTAPEKFFQTPHYEGYPGVLVRLEAIGLEELEMLLKEAWLLKAPVRVRKKFEESLG